MQPRYIHVNQKSDFFSSLLVGFGSASPRYGPDLEVSNLTIQGFDQRKGQLVDDLADRSSNQYALSLVVTIELAGPPGTFEAARKAEVVVRRGGKAMTHAMAIGPLDAQTGHYYQMLIVDGPLCDAVTISARVLRHDPSRSLTKTLEFRCGE